MKIELIELEYIHTEEILLTMQRNGQLINPVKWMNLRSRHGSPILRMMPEGPYKFGPPSKPQTLQDCYKRQKQKQNLLSENKAFWIFLLEQHSLYLITHSKSQ